MIILQVVECFFPVVFFSVSFFSSGLQQLCSISLPLFREGRSLVVIRAQHNLVGKFLNELVPVHIDMG